MTKPALPGRSLRSKADEAALSVILNAPHISPTLRAPDDSACRQNMIYKRARLRPSPFLSTYFKESADRIALDGREGDTFNGSYPQRLSSC
jgi:hypothetical protein